MASNTLRPADKPRRTNVPRPAAPAPEELAPEPLPVAVEAAPEPEPAPAPTKRRRKERPEPEPKPRSSWSLFSLLDRVTSMDGLFREGLPVQFLPHLLFLMLITLLYIGNTHYGNRMSRSIQKLKQETEDLRADYTTLKSDYMEASKQSEVARKVAAIGLVESSSPPFRITVPAGRLDEAELELMPVLTADTLAARAARDSAATHLADSLRGRPHYANAPLQDDTPEAGAPPPGPADSVAAANPLAGPAAHSVLSTAKARAKAARRDAAANGKGKTKAAAKAKSAAKKPAAKPRQSAAKTAKAKSAK